MAIIEAFIQFIKKQIFLQPVVARMFPFIDSTILKYATGLMLRYLCYVFSSVIKNNIYDQYCEVSHQEYISAQTMLLCEYRTYIEMTMKWILDVVNQILSEDHIVQSLTRIETSISTLTNRVDALTDRVDALSNDVNDLRVELRGDILPQLLTAEDLQHS